MADCLILRCKAMKIKEVKAIYFSPTGTTQKVVRTVSAELAKSLGAAFGEYDFTLPGMRLGFADVSSDSLAVFGVPTYAGRVPNVLLKYLETVSGKGSLAVAAVTFGNRNFDNSLIELRDILENTGFHTIGALAASCEHSFSYSLGAGRPDSLDLAELRGFAGKLARKVTGLCTVPEPVRVPGTPDSYGGYYKPQDRQGSHIDIRKVVPKVSEKCICCGTCAAVCPMGSISPDDVRLMQGICIKCGACVKKCPAAARYFDDAGYLYHKTELEEMYERRACNSFFL